MSQQSLRKPYRPLLLLNISLVQCIPAHLTNQIDYITIDVNVKCVHSQVSEQLYSDVKSVNSVFVFDKIINNSDSFRIKYLSGSEISVILCVL